MKKEELVELTLKQLLDAFKSAPESFEYQDNTYTPAGYCAQPTIMWQPKFELKSLNGNIVPDPNNTPKTVVVRLEMGTWSCYILPYAVTCLSDISDPRADAVVKVKQRWLRMSSNYRKFMKLKKLILSRDRNRQNDKFLRKLCDTFPAAVDEHLLG